MPTTSPRPSSGHEYVETARPGRGVTQVSFTSAATLGVALFAILSWSYSAYRLFALAPEQRVQFVPDDAYYYFGLARNFALHGEWSFDSGVSLTTGFHPLHAYALSAIYLAAHPADERFVDLGLLLSEGLALLALLAGVLMAVRSGHLIAALALLLFALSRNVSLNSVSATEWSWVVVLSACYCLAFHRLSSERRTPASIGLVVTGVLGSLARTDFGLLPAALAAASVLTIRSTSGRRRFWSALAGLTATGCGALVALAHNYATTGQFLQSSARMKSLWMRFEGPSVRPFAGQAITLFGPDSRSTFFLAGVLALVASGLAAYAFLRRERDGLRAVNPESPAAGSASGTLVLWCGSALTILSYSAFYSFNPIGMQHWYTAGIVVPVLLCLCLPFNGVRVSHPAHLAVVALLLVLIVRLTPGATRLTAESEWPHQASSLEAGRYLREQKPGGLVGSWNAGIIGYYEGGHVVNIDGLVNNDIYPYAAENRLPDYLDKKGITYVIDFANMLSLEQQRRRNGYDSPSFLRRLVLVKQFDQRTRGWQRLGLYEVRAK
jgi:hypothetical protein